MSRLRRTAIEPNVAVSVFVFRAGAPAWLRGAIVTGDDDLLTLAPESLIPILTPAALRALP